MFQQSGPSNGPLYPKYKFIVWTIISANMSTMAIIGLLHMYTHTIVIAKHWYIFSFRHGHRGNFDISVTLEL